MSVRPRGNDAHTIGSGDDTLHPGPSGRRSPRPEDANDAGTSAVLLQIGAVLGNRYEILELLGEGGMGAVYKAADREVGRIVALKVIRPEMASNPEILARFKQELLLSSKVTHRNVIRIYDLGEAQGVKFITMEYLEGENLHQILKQREKLEVAEAVDIMEQVASGLAAAHAVGIIHRDLKPGNIMRDKKRPRGGDGLWIGAHVLRRWHDADRSHAGDDRVHVSGAGAGLGSEGQFRYLYGWPDSL